MKKFVIFLAICVVGLFNIGPSIELLAESKTDDNIIQELNNCIDVQIGNFDFNELDLYLSKLSSQYSFLSANTFKDVVKQITLGDYFSDFNSVFDVIFSFLFSEIKNVLPVIFLIVAVSVISGLLNLIKASSSGDGVGSVIYFVCYAVIVLLISTIIKNVVDVTSSTLQTMSGQMEIIFPILLTLLTSIGSVASVGIYKPLVSVLIQGVSFLFSNFLFPIFIISFVLLVVGNLSTTIKLNKASEFLSSVFKWVVGFVFTMFGAFLTIQGISVARYDGISIKATKFAVKSYIPLIGGYLSDGLDLILCSSVIIKNAIGLVGLVLILLTIISPIIKIVVLKFGLQLVSAILEPIGNSGVSNFTSGCSKVLVYPIVLILSVAFMYLLSVGLIMSTANIF